MVYRKSHNACRLLGCNRYASYIKIRGKWVKVGYFNTKCKHFNYEPDPKAKELMQEVNKETECIDSLKFAHRFLKGEVNPEDPETEEIFRKNFGVSVE